VDAELLGQLAQRLVAFYWPQRDLRLEDRPMIPSRSLHRLAPFVGRPSVGWVKPGYHIPYCQNFEIPFCQGVDDSSRLVLERSHLAIVQCVNDGPL
jgi:hypothetical protein